MDTMLKLYRLIHLVQKIATKPTFVVISSYMLIKPL